MPCCSGGSGFNGVLDRYEVVVVDDVTDGTPDWLRSQATRFPHVRLFEQDHGGPAQGRNNGVRQALGDVIVFIDSDLVVTNSFGVPHAGPIAPGNRTIRGCVLPTEL